MQLTGSQDCRFCASVGSCESFPKLPETPSLSPPASDSRCHKPGFTLSWTYFKEPRDKANNCFFCFCLGRPGQLLAREGTCTESKLMLTCPTGSGLEDQRSVIGFVLGSPPPQAVASTISNNVRALLAHHTLQHSLPEYTLSVAPSLTPDLVL